MGAREAALRVLAGSERGRARSDDLLAGVLSDPGLGHADRSLVKELVSGVLRNRARLDHLLNGSLLRGVASLTVHERNILRLGLYQLAYLDRIPQSAAVNESVKLARRFGRRGTIGLTNAVLRDIIRKGAWRKPLDIPDGYARLAVERSHPEWLVRKWDGLIGRDETAALLSANNAAAPLTVRANVLKTTPGDLFVMLADAGFEPRRNPLAATALDIGRPSGLAGSRLFQQGLCYVQDAAAQVVSSLAAGCAGAMNLDLCCSPGGKLSAIAALAAPGAVILGIDISAKKLARVLDNLGRLGIDRVALARADAAGFASRRLFDLVLADVPCSGLGVLRRRLDLRWRIKPADVPRLADLQASILENAARLVAPGGRLIYATCTLVPEENEFQVGRFLERHHEFAPVRPDLPASMLQGDFLYLWPHRHAADGAFAAVLARR